MSKDQVGPLRRQLRRLEVDIAWQEAMLVELTPFRHIRNGLNQELADMAARIARMRLLRVQLLSELGEADVPDVPERLAA